MNLNMIFDRLWKDYSEQNPSANRISDLLKNEGENVVNDHIAFRSIDTPEVNINVLAVPFINEGYVPAGEYVFKEKHLFAKHFEIPGNRIAPRIFISQLILDECSSFIRKTFSDSIKKVDFGKLDSDQLIFAGQIFSPLSYNTYDRLRNESEYAAWFYVFGFRANHFTVSVNALKKYNSIYKINKLIKKNGFTLNTTGGEVKGTRSDLLQQSSTMADLLKVNFIEGVYEIPSCYYEFAQRYPDENGELYSGFIAKSADKIFESTNLYKKRNPS
jgi:hypothetical protein